MNGIVLIFFLLFSYSFVFFIFILFLFYIIFFLIKVLFSKMFFKSFKSVFLFKLILNNEVAIKTIISNLSILKLSLLFIQKCEKFFVSRINRLIVSYFQYLKSLTFFYSIPYFLFLVVIIVTYFLKSLFRVY